MEERPWHQHYDEGVPASIDYPPIPVHQLLNDTVAKYPDNTALIFFDNKLTYRQFNTLVDKFAAGLQQLGLKKGDRVTIVGVVKQTKAEVERAEGRITDKYKLDIYIVEVQRITRGWEAK